MLLALDPGQHCCGWALWTTTLQDCGLVRTKEEHLGAQALDLARQLPRGHDVIVEIPRLYPRSRKLQPNDLIRLAFAGGVCGGVGVSLETIEPVAWKGQVPKDVCHRRLIKELSYEEVLVIEKGLEGVPKGLHHNVLDAVGIGRHVVTRSV